MLLHSLLIVAATYLVGDWLAGLAAAVLLLVWRLLPSEEGPPVLALAMSMQWLQVTAGVFYGGLTDRMLPAMLQSDYRPMVLIGLGCVTALTIGLFFGRWAVRTHMAVPEQPPVEVVGWKLLLGAYVGSVAVTGIVQQLAWQFPTLTQAILALSYARLAILFLVFRRLASPRLRGELILALLLFEVALGFTGYYSGFKEPLLLAVMATLENFDPRRTQHWVTGAVLALMLGLAGVMWMGVRTEFRRDFDDEVFAASRSTRVERMQALTTDWIRQSSDRIEQDMDVLVDRLWAVYYPALAVDRVPDVLPHTDGQILTDALVHLVTPRLLFPNKPELPSDSELVRKYSGVLVAGAEENTSIAFGYAAESYVDFGIPVMFLPMVVFGLLMGMAYEALLRTIHHRELAIALVTVIFWLGLYLFERSWIKTLGFSLTLIVYLGGLSFLVDRWLLLRVVREQRQENLEAEALYDTHA